MSAEFPAQQARDITDNCDLNVQLWYAKFKDDLFYYVQDACSLGHDHIRVEADEWNNRENYKNYLKQRLISLGYKVDLRGQELIISW